jgi:sulfite exporter TauE/SafE
LASCGPLLISYTAGTRKGFLPGLAAYGLFTAGRIAAYLALALAVYWLGQEGLRGILAVSSVWLYAGAGLFTLAVGILLIAGTDMTHGLCCRAQRLLIAKDRKTMALMGVLIGVLPCGPLLFVLSYLGLIAHSWAQVIACALSFGAGTALSPLCLLAVGGGMASRCASGKLVRVINIFCGGVVTLMGLLLLRRAFL